MPHARQGSASQRWWNSTAWLPPIVRPSGRTEATSGQLGLLREMPHRAGRTSPPSTHDNDTEASGARRRRRALGWGSSVGSRRLSCPRSWSTTRSIDPRWGVGRRAAGRGPRAADRRADQRAASGKRGLVGPRGNSAQSRAEEQRRESLLLFSQLRHSRRGSTLLLINRAKVTRRQPAASAHQPRLHTRACSCRGLRIESCPGGRNVTSVGNRDVSLEFALDDGISLVDIRDRVTDRSLL